MDDVMMSCPEGLSAADQAVFERVWKRVMPSPEDCPIEIEVGTTLVGGDLPCVCTRSERPLPAVPAGEPHTYGEGEEEDVPRLGRSSAMYEGQLQQQILEELRRWQLYRHLARRGRSQFSRPLTALAQNSHRAARQLAAAHFLISGVRYWPLEQLSAPSIPSFLGTVRRCFQGEQQRGQSYLLAAGETGDPALRELYAALAGDSEEHARLLQTMLEQSPL